VTAPRFPARALAVAIAVACAHSVPEAQTSAPPPNQLTAAERAAGWKLLFDGTTLNGWRGLGYDSIPTAHWRVDHGAIRKIPAGEIPRLADGQPAAGGDLMSIGTYGDFELAWEWKIGRAGNSGVKYNVSEALSISVAANHAAIGFEYQLLDDSLNSDNKIPSHLAGSLYDMIPSNAGTLVRPVGEWNASRVVFKGNHIEHWLNGRKVVEVDLGTARYDSVFQKSKYRTIKDFSVRKKGHIVLQDHGEEIFFRSIKIKEGTP